VPGTSGFNLGSSTLRWNTFATNANLSGTLVVSDSTISSSLLTGSVRFNGGIAISGNASIGQSLNFYNTAATFYTGFRAGTISANTLYTLPTNFPGAGSSVLQSDTSGVLTWVGSIGLATTATNVNVVSASTSASHPVLFTPSAGTASGAAVSSEPSFVYNPSTDILSVSGLAVTSTTASTSLTTGALLVAGGVGITGRLNVGTRTTTSGNANILAAFASSNNSGASSVILQNTSPAAFSYSGLQFENDANNATINFWSSNSLDDSNKLRISTPSGDIHLFAGFGKTVRINTNSGSSLYLDATGVFIQHTTNSASATSGALVVSGGAGIAKTSYFGQSVFIQGTTASGSTTTGALVVTGGAGIGGSIFGGSTISAADNIEIRSGKELRLNNSGNTFYTGLKAGANASNTK
jgi:hypothetical protein